MPTNIVKCPECGTISKVHGKRTFVCCGTKWGITECLITPKNEQSDEERLEGTPVEEEIDLNAEDKLPVRRKTRKVVKEEEDKLICPYCKGDIYATQRKGIYYCARCERYLIED